MLKKAVVQTSTASLPHSLWRNMSFLILWGGQTISTLGNQISNLALPLLVLALTGSVVQAGSIAAIESLPYVVFSLPAGALIDRWNRKVVMISCDGARCLVLASIPLAYISGHLSIIQLYIVALVEGTAYVFFNIAQTAALPCVVHEAQLSQANALNSTTEWGTQLIGPGLSGFIIGIARNTLIGAALAYLLDSLSFLISVVSLLFIRTPFQRERISTERKSLRVEIVNGLHFVWTRPILRSMALLTMGVNLFLAPSYLAIIVLSRNSLHIDVGTIGLVFSVSSVGGLIGSFLVPRISKYLRVGGIIISSMIILALAMSLLALAISPIMVAVGSAFIAITQPIYGVTQVTYRLKITPDELQGRVNSTFRLLAFGMPPLGLAVGGLLMGYFGPRPVLGLLALGLILCAIIASFTELRKAV